MLSPIAKVVDKETIYTNTNYVNNDIRTKLEKVLTPWENRNFLFWIVMDNTNFNNVILVVQSVHIDNLCTFVFNTTLGNYEASLYENVKLFRETASDMKNLDLDDKNVIINKWWKNYLWSLPKHAFSGELQNAIKKENK